MSPAFASETTDPTSTDTTTADTTPTTAEQKDDGPPLFSPRDIFELARAVYDLGVDQDGRPVAIPHDHRAPRVAREIGALGPDLRRRLFAERGIVVGDRTLRAALDQVRAHAEAAPLERTWLRSAPVGASLHIDLGDVFGTFVEVTPFGWEVRRPLDEDDADAARATFERTRLTRPLPVPVAGGSREQLAGLLGLDTGGDTFRLVWGWLVAALFADVPRPLLWALGPQGSGKSTRARMALSLIDPADALGREPGKSERDDSTTAAARFLPSWDNIGTVSAATSDWLCRLVTGVEISRRALYTDSDARASTLRRTGVATSIVLPFGLGPDALERLVLLELDRVAEADRRPEADLWTAFEAARPAILGALLDDVAGVLAHRSAVARDAAETRTPLPRMADYALILAALDRHLDVDAEAGYLGAYDRSVSTVLADRAEADPLTAGLIAVARSRGGTFEGPASVLLKALEAHRPDDPRAAWPHDPRSLSSALTVNAETLRSAGLVTDRRKTNGTRVVVLTLLDYTPTNVDENVLELHRREEKPDRILPDVATATSL